MQGDQQVAAAGMQDGGRCLFLALVQSREAGQAGHRAAHQRNRFIGGEVVAAQAAARVHDPFERFGRGVGGLGELVGEYGEQGALTVGVRQVAQLSLEEGVVGVGLGGTLQDRLPGQVGERFVEELAQAEQRRHRVDQRASGHRAPPGGQGVEHQLRPDLAGVGIAAAGGQKPFGDFTAVEERAGSLVRDGLGEIRVSAGPGGDDGTLDLGQGPDFGVTDPPGDLLGQDGIGCFTCASHAVPLPS